VPAGIRFSANITLDDHVICEGEIAAPEGGAIHLNAGVEVLPGGSVNLGTGELRVTDRASGMSGGDLSAGREHVGPSYRGFFTQTDGTHTVAGPLFVAHGAGSRATFKLSGGTVESESASVGVFGRGAFELTGGTQQVRTGLYVGHESNSNGRYSLGGTGRLEAQHEFIGFNGFGTMTQTGGANLAADALTIAYGPGSWGTYTITAGTLVTPILRVAPSGDGTFSIVGAAPEITVSREFSLGQHARLQASSGATVHMAGADLNITSTLPQNLTSLAGLTLAFAGGDGKSLVEAPGRDLGPVPEGWTGNFAVGVLKAGGSAPARVSLVDLVDNSRQTTDPEALYVDTLVLDAGGTISTDGLNLYYLNGGDPKRFIMGDANLDGETGIADLSSLADNYGRTGTTWIQCDFNGDRVTGIADLSALADHYGEATGQATAPVPEPAALAVLSIGALLLPIRRRKRARCP